MKRQVLQIPKNTIDSKHPIHDIAKYLKKDIEMPILVDVYSG